MSVTEPTLIGGFFIYFHCKTSEKCDRQKSKKILLIINKFLLVPIVATLAASTRAELLVTKSFGSGANAFTMDFVTIGNPNNAADTTGSPNPVGSVAYTYNLGKFEVSRDMITKANSAGNLGITMFDLTGYGGNGVNDSQGAREAGPDLSPHARGGLDRGSVVNRKSSYIKRRAIYPARDYWMCGTRRLGRRAARLKKEPVVRALFKNLTFLKP